MTTAKNAHPEYHKAFLADGFFPGVKGRVKFQETSECYLYRAGGVLYKIRREHTTPDSPAVTEAYTQAVRKAGELWAPGVYGEVLPITRHNGGVALGGEGTPFAYAQKLVFLTGGHWLEKLFEQGKFTPIALGRLARFLAERHAVQADKEPAAELGRPEYLRALFEEVFYQAKKYVGVTVPPQLPDFVERPVYRFIEDSRKLLRRRQKKNRIVACHGAFRPEHLYFRGREIFAISPLYGAPKFRQLDAAADVAALLNELELKGLGALCPLFLKRYASHSKDRDAARMAPIYRTLQAVHRGQLLSETAAAPHTPAEEKEHLLAEAHAYFNLAAMLAPTLNA